MLFGEFTTGLMKGIKALKTAILQIYFQGKNYLFSHRETLKRLLKLLHLSLTIGSGIKVLLGYML